MIISANLKMRNKTASKRNWKNWIMPNNNLQKNWKKLNTKKNKSNLLPIKLNQKTKNLNCKKVY